MAFIYLFMDPLGRSSQRWRAASHIPWHLFIYLAIHPPHGIHCHSARPLASPFIYLFTPLPPTGAAHHLLDEMYMDLFIYLPARWLLHPPSAHRPPRPAIYLFTYLADPLLLGP